MEMFVIEVIEVNGVEYKCCVDDEINRVSEAVRMNHDSKEEMKLLAFRNYFEVNGDRYVLTKITEFKKCNAFIISIPNNVKNLGKESQKLNGNSIRSYQFRRLSTFL
jgi:hypothetical protein